MTADHGSRLLGGALLALATATGVHAQTRAVTAEDYARAERFVAYNANPLVDHAVTTVTWLDASGFWYRDHDATGDRFLRFDVATGRASPLFDHKQLADALAKAGGKPVDATKLRITEARVAHDGGYEVVVGKARYLCGDRKSVV